MPAFHGAAGGPLVIPRAIARVYQMGKLRPKERKGLARNHAVRLSQSHQHLHFSKKKKKKGINTLCQGLVPAK